MKITPIVWPAINWHGFVTETDCAIKRSPTKSIDACPYIKAGSDLSFLAALGEFQSEWTEPFQYIRSGGGLHHLSCSFLCETDKETFIEICRLGQLIILGAQTNIKNEVFILTGTFAQWQHAIAIACNEDQKHILREFFTNIFFFFEKKGLAELWHHWSKQVIDNTLILERK